MDLRRTVALHTAAWLLHGLFAAAAVQQIAFVIGRLGGSPGLVALASTGPQALALLSFVVVPWGRRRPSRVLVASSRLASAALFGLALLRPGPGGLAAIAFVSLGLFQVGSTFYGRLLDGLYPPAGRGRRVGVPMFVSAAVTAAAGPLAGWLLGRCEAAYALVIPAAAVAGCLSALLVFAFPVRETLPPPASRSTIGGDARVALKDRPYMVWTLVYTGVSVGYRLFHAAQPVYFARMAGFGYWENGLALGAYNLAYCAGLLAWGRIRDRAGSLPTMVAAWMLVGVGTALQAVRPALEWVMLSQVLVGAGLSGNDLARLLVVLEFAPADSVDRYMGLFMTLYGARALAGGLLAATLMELSAAGSRTGLVVAAATMIAGAAWMAILRPRKAVGARG